MQSWWGEPQSRRRRGMDRRLVEKLGQHGDEDVDEDEVDDDEVDDRVHERPPRVRSLHLIQVVLAQGHPPHRAERRQRRAEGKGRVPEQRVAEQREELYDEQEDQGVPESRCKRGLSPGQMSWADVA